MTEADYFCCGRALGPKALENKLTSEASCKNHRKRRKRAARAGSRGKVATCYTGPVGVISRVIRLHWTRPTRLVALISGAAC